MAKRADVYNTILGIDLNESKDESHEIYKRDYYKYQAIKKWVFLCKNQ